MTMRPTEERLREIALCMSPGASVSDHFMAKQLLAEIDALNDEVARLSNEISSYRDAATRAKESE